MTSRTDIDVDFEVFPRLINITSSSQELSVQDAHDTLTDIEDSDHGESGAQYPGLIRTEGGQPLPGGVSVGLTTALQNCQIAPGSTSPRTTSTITSTDLTGFILTDTGKDFVALGVVRGDWIINFTDQSVTEVLTVNSATELRTRGLREGASNAFTIGDDYKIWEVRAFSLDGGNFTAVDESQVEISPYFSVFGVFGNLTASSSATTQEQADIEFSSFQGAVWIDQTTSNTGTVFPTGTPRRPVNNLVDAQAIADSRGFFEIRTLSHLVIGPTAVHQEMKFIGRSPKTTTITIADAADVTNCEYQDALVTGYLDGLCFLTRCAVKNLFYISGHLEQCVLREGTITLAGSGVAMFNRCSGVDATNPGVGIPTVDFGGTGQALAMKGYDGEVRFTNKSGTDAVSIDLASGAITLEDSVNAGEIVMRGVGTWVNRETYAGNATIVNQLVEGSLIQLLDRTVYGEKVTVDSANGTVGTLFPIGSPKFPVNNLTEALSISQNLNIPDIFLRTNMTLPVGPDFGACVFSGISASRTILTAPSGALVGGALYSDLVVTGELTGFTTMERCQSFGISGFNGFMLNVALVGGQTLELGGAAQTVLLDCWSTTDAAGAGATIDMGGAGQALQLRNFAGDVTIINKTGADLASVEMAGGSIVLDSTLTAGTIYLRGVGDWVNRNTYTGTTTVVDELVKGHQVQELYKHSNLDPTDAITVTQTRVSSASGGIVVDITGNGTTSNTFTRQ